MNQKILQIIQNIIEENDLPKIENSEITEDSVLADDLGLDSLNLAQLTVEVESEFGVDIFENGVISTVGDIFKQLK